MDRFEKLASTALVIIAVLFIVLGINDWYDCMMQGGVQVRSRLSWQYVCVQPLVPK